MTKHRSIVLGLVALLALPSTALAQDSMSFDDGGDDSMSFDDTGGDDSMSFDDGGGDSMSFGDGGDDGAGGDDGTGIGGLGNLLGSSSSPTFGAEEPADEIDTAALAEPDIWAVQQAYVLHGGRFELTPYYGTSLNDPFVTHNCFGVAFGWYITEVLGISADFQWFQELGLESDDAFHIARSFRLVVPINEYQLGAHLHFSYLPIYGKLTIFNKWIFHWDVFIEGGVGLLMSRPIPVVDPEVRTFEFGSRVAANIGIGGRIFLTKFVAIYAQLIDYIYMEKLENLRIAPSETTDRLSPDWAQSRFNSDTWLGESKLTNNVMIHIGASIFFPFTFDYEFPK